MKALVISNKITRRDEKSIEKYLNEISKFEVLTADEELILFERFNNGDKAALEEILARNLRFVVSVAKQYQHLGLSLNDLINEGNLGLIKAAKRFDTTRGFKFISYAVWWIRQSILQAVNDKSEKIRMPLNQKSTLSKIRKCQEELLQKLDREPTLDEIEEKTGMNIDQIDKILKANVSCRSLDAPSLTDEEFDMKNFLEDPHIPRPDDEVGKESLKIEIQHLLGKLKGPELQTIIMSFGIGRERPLSLEEISDVLHVSRERVRQIRAKALKRLRSYINSHGLTFSLN